jgi:hypothetical protein
MVSYKDKIITFPLFNTCYPQNLARNLARLFNLTGIDLTWTFGLIEVEMLKCFKGVNSSDS